LNIRRKSLLTAAELNSLKEGYRVWISLPVQWGDQDAFQHVNNVVYLRWFESARIAYGNQTGLQLLDVGGQKIGPILAALSCNYRRQLNFPDTVHVGARVTRIGNSSLKMEHRIISEALGAVVADGDSTLVAFDYISQKPVPVPDSVRDAIAKLEGHA
jgi:acyl-CoA thioester hydrolase